MKIIVNDTSILIDLMNISLLDVFLELDFEFHTNDLIINEITDIEQKAIINKVISENKLIVNETKAEDYPRIISLLINNLSIEDCSIWYYAQQIEGVLLTGDARLRKEVEKTNVEVRGVLFVFDKLIEENKITKNNAINKLTELLNINPRLPKKEIKKRIELWSSL
jgi:predicted nucleic acid-binding protein